MEQKHLNLLLQNSLNSNFQSKEWWIVVRHYDQSILNEVTAFNPALYTVTETGVELPVIETGKGDANERGKMLLETATFDMPQWMLYCLSVLGLYPSLPRNPQDIQSTIIQ